MKAVHTRGGESEAGGLELVAGGEEDSDDEAGDQRATVDSVELTVIHDGQGDEGEGHAKEIEQKRRGVLKGVFDEDDVAPRRRRQQAAEYGRECWG